MKVYKVFTAGQTGPVHPLGTDLSCAGFVMNKGTLATFKAPTGITFTLQTTDEPQTFEISISEVTSNNGIIVILG
jgi:hypothetical protein